MNEAETGTEVVSLVANHSDLAALSRMKFTSASLLNEEYCEILACKTQPPAAV